MAPTPKPFHIDRFVQTIAKHYPHWQAPVITFIAQKGSTPFEILVSTLLSLRTKDQVTMEASTRLFEKARSPEEILNLPPKTIEKLIYPVGFYNTKAQRLREISRILIDKYHGQVPDKLEELLKLPGIGRKSANLVMVEGFKQDAICVDTHVHRISNRIGYVQTKTPEKTEMALRQKLPRKYWIKYNELLVAFGQVICRPISPLCSQCPVEGMCPQIGVNKHR
jgi:endonuclease-3